MSKAPALIEIIAVLSLSWKLEAKAARWCWLKAGEEIDVPARRIHLHVSEEELTLCRLAWTPPAPRYERGFGAMYADHVGQSDESCDFDFLLGTAAIPEPEIH